MGKIASQNTWLSGQRRQELDGGRSTHTRWRCRSGPGGEREGVAAASRTALPLGTDPPSSHSQSSAGLVRGALLRGWAGAVALGPEPARQVRLWANWDGRPWWWSVWHSRVGGVGRCWDTFFCSLFARD